MNQQITARRDARIPVLVVVIWIAVLVCATSEALKDETGGEPDTAGSLVVDGDRLLLTREPSRGLAAIEPQQAALVYGKVPVNRAGTAVLQIVPGIGPELARRIVAERQRGGIYGGADHLTRVPGIGPVRARQFQEFLLFD
jgi:DNA uptake protein ComE-like DNA-binding protein